MGTLVQDVPDMKCPECGKTVVFEKKMVVKAADSHTECQSCGAQVTPSGSRRLAK